MESRPSRLVAGSVLAVFTTIGTATRVGDVVASIESQSDVALAVGGIVIGATFLAVVAARRGRDDEVVPTDPGELAADDRASVEPATVGPKDATDWDFRDDESDDETSGAPDCSVVEVVVDADATDDAVVGGSADATPGPDGDVGTEANDESDAEAVASGAENDWQFDRDLETR